MKKYTHLIFLLGIPILASLFYLSAPIFSNYRVHKNIIEEIQKDNLMTENEKKDEIDRVKEIDYAQICFLKSENAEKFQLSAQNFCKDQKRYYYLFLSSIITFGLGVLFLAIFKLMAKISEKSREKLLQYFKKSWAIVRVASLIILISEVTILFFLFFDFTTLLFHIYFPQMLGALVIGACLLVFSLLKIFLGKIPSLERAETGHVLTQSESPQLWEAVKILAQKIGTQAPDKIIIGYYPNFYVTETPLMIAGERLEGRLLYLSHPLLQRLSRDEALAIIGHELGHFRSEDTIMTSKFYPIYRGVGLALTAMYEHGPVGLPAAKLVEYFVECFSPIEAKFGRDRELIADKLGADVTSSLAAARALIKIHIFSEAWGSAESEALKKSSTFEEEFPLSIKNILTEISVMDHLKKWSLTHPMDTHPPLLERLSHLGFKLEEFNLSELGSDIPLENLLSLVEKQEEIAKEMKEASECELKQVKEFYDIKTADDQSEAGKVLLSSLFPEQTYQASKAVLYFIGGLTFLLALLFGYMLITPSYSEIYLRFVALALFWTMASVSYYSFTRWAHRKVKVCFDRVENSCWARPLYFRDVERITATNNNGAIHLCFYLKSKEGNPKKPNRILRWHSRTAVDLNCAALDQKGSLVAGVIFKYFFREK